ncbi:HNH endonuclease [Methylocella sp.]|jgi:hypothetical protein|uniref:HNH endonuclease n=1 Tax=Methylocella sp. TaxID=1978226 RepID=UPI003C18DBA4
MLTAERARELFAYDPESGLLTRLVRTANRTRAGDIAGSPRKDGYLEVGIDNKTYLVHRVAFLIMEGRFPPHDTDHENLDRADNRWVNIRPATNSQNQANRGVRKNNKLGVKSVSLDKRSGKYRARIRVSGKQYTLLTSADPEMCAFAYELAAMVAFGEFARTA